MFPHVLNFHVPNFKRFRWPFTFYLTYNILHSIDISSAISYFCPMRGSRDTQFGPKIKALSVHCLYLCIFPMCDWGWPKWAVAGRIVVCVCVSQSKSEKREKKPFNHCHVALKLCGFSLTKESSHGRLTKKDFGFAAAAKCCQKIRHGFLIFLWFTASQLDPLEFARIASFFGASHLCGCY